MSRTHSRAVVIAIGDELVLGQSIDTNSAWVASRLIELGVSPFRHVTVADQTHAIAAELERSAAEADLVIVTGGLGPTRDDLTREALARAMGDTLVEDEAAIAEIRAWYEGRGREMPATNRVQAMRPSGGRSLSNDRGTAPGLWGDVGHADVFCLPGPPGEMRPMFERFVAPAVNAERVVRTRVLRTFGLGESRVAEILGDLMRRDRNPLVGTTASTGVVTVRMRWEGSRDEARRADDALDAAEHQVRDALGAAIVTPREGDGGRDLPEVVLAMLRERGERLAVVESCTGGLLGAMLTEVPGSSDVFTGGWITYTNAMKAEEVGVPESFFPEVRPGAPGAVSSEVAQAMALGGLNRARHAIGHGPGVSHALAITGIAGPDGGSEAKPVGTVWICRASADGSTDCRRFIFRGSRDAVRRWSAITALGILRLKLADLDLTLLNEQERRAV